LSLRAAASLASPPSGARPGRRPASVVRAAASPAALDKRNRRREQNVSGEFFVDHRCIDCATCRWMAPEVFKRVDGMSAVAAQPSSEEERTKALQGVYLCGYHSESSYGATSYLIVHPEGNIMVDSDDVADHRKWAERLKCERIIHSGDVVDITADVEWKLTGSGPWNIGSDFELIHTPGHTEGSVCLLYKPLKALFTGDHVAKSEYSDELNLFRMYSKQSVNLQLDSMRKLLDLDFEWYLPGEHPFIIAYKIYIYYPNSV
uniref:Metallo-beta-lactamase domain-containing protein n=1 Tax=Aegilops tauschii subsp. strangulata TaxID=200361 RepID=A0A453AT05_AEGTS